MNLSVAFLYSFGVMVEQAKCVGLVKPFYRLLTQFCNLFSTTGGGDDDAAEEEDRESLSESF